MAYKFKQYGHGFKILGKYQGWHYGIWTDSMPERGKNLLLVLAVP